ncbi:tripartite motif-containing protein 45-like [Dendronephthya gigantea]|uniref:tripartite motif-containing protein 45-like n=1 Tax=Dendronephthya gigantea TaxID=151771 RepID=UPI00106BD93C|nr:tripartite motif-containing protein 45-like [Dendronephthya gigantea]
MSTSCGHSDDGMAKEVESSPECTVCRETMNDPRTLPCFHSFCKVCLEGIVENTRKKAKYAKNEDFNCPSCRAVFHLKPNQEVAELSCGHEIRNTLETGQLRNKENSNCSRCVKNEACTCCLTCELFLCEECLAEHNSIQDCWPGFEKEPCSLLTLEELKKPENHSKIKDNGVPYCGKHPNKELKFFCETCKEIVCSCCMEFIHTPPHHNLEQTDHILGKKKESLESSVGAFKKKLASGIEALVTISDLEGKLKSNTQKLKESAKQTNVRVKIMLLQLLDEIAMKKQDEIDELYNKTQAAITKQKNEIETFVSDVNISYDSAREILEKGTAVEIIESAIIAETMLDSFEKYEKTKLTNIH